MVTVMTGMRQVLVEGMRVRGKCGEARGQPHDGVSRKRISLFDSTFVYKHPSERSSLFCLFTYSYSRSLANVAALSKSTVSRQPVSSCQPHVSEHPLFSRP